MIDYPPTINDLALNFLILSDLIIIPVNDGLGAFKGLIDLKNTLNYICQKKNERERRERFANDLGFEKDKSKVNSEASTSQSQNSSSKSQKM